MSTNSSSSLALTCDSEKKYIFLLCIFIFNFANFSLFSFCLDKFSCLLGAADAAHCVDDPTETILALTATTHYIKRDVESSSSSDDCTIYDKLVFDGHTVKREKVTMKIVYYYFVIPDEGNRKLLLLFGFSNSIALVPVCLRPVIN